MRVCGHQDESQPIGGAVRHATSLNPKSHYLKVIGNLITKVVFFLLNGPSFPVATSRSYKLYSSGVLNYSTASSNCGGVSTIVPWRGGPVVARWFRNRTVPGSNPVADICVEQEIYTPLLSLGRLSLAMPLRVGKLRSIYPYGNN